MIFGRRILLLRLLDRLNAHILSFHSKNLVEAGLGDFDGAAYAGGAST
jgi:hypothetical protein